MVHFAGDSGQLPRLEEMLTVFRRESSLAGEGFSATVGHTLAGSPSGEDVARFSSQLESSDGVLVIASDWVHAEQVFTVLPERYPAVLVGAFPAEGQLRTAVVNGLVFYASGWNEGFCAALAGAVRVQVGCLNQKQAISHLQEKNTILETILDIFSHDTRNAFLSVQGLVQQVPDTGIKSILQDSLEELLAGAMEALGFLGGKKRIFSIAEMVSTLRLTRARILLSAHPRLSLQITQPRLVFAEVSAVVKNAFLNIIENALKYTPECEMIEVSIAPEGSWIVTRIRDSGCGIPDAEKELVFERSFRRAETAEIEGTGKGLWISRNIVQKEGGTVHIEDAPGGGAVFVIRLPAFVLENREERLEELAGWYGLSLPDILQRERNMTALLCIENGINQLTPFMESMVFANLLHNIRAERREMNTKPVFTRLEQLRKMNPDAPDILVVDDSLHVHSYLASLLTGLGYRIAGYAFNGRDGIDLALRLRPKIITLDYTMHEITGLEAAKAIIAEYPEARFIFITGLANHPELIKNVSDALPADSFRLLIKPLYEKDLAIALKGFTGGPSGCR